MDYLIKLIKDNRRPILTGLAFITDIVTQIGGNPNGSVSKVTSRTRKAKHTTPSNKK